MSIRASIAVVLAIMVSAVLFGIGATTVLSIESLSANAATLLPIVIVASFILAVPISWYMAPMLRARYQRHLKQQTPARAPLAVSKL